MQPLAIHTCWQPNAFHPTSAEAYIQENGGIDFTRQSRESVSFTCTADGIPTPTILWLRNGTLLQASLNPRLSVSGETLSSGLRPNIAESRRSTLTISDLSERDSGSYSCRASNQVGMTAELREPYRLTVAPRMWSEVVHTLAQVYRVFSLSPCRATSKLLC